MMDAAKKYGTRMEILTTTKEVVKQLPIWYHAQADRKIHQLIASHNSKYLLKIHNISTAGDTANYRLTNGHQDSWYCRCNACATIRDTGLPPRWNPAKIPIVNAPENDTDDWITFLPSLVTAATIKDIFRVFTEGEQHGALVNTEIEPGPRIMVATDGYTLDTGTTAARAGAGISYRENDPRNKSLRLPSAPPQTNQVAELTAIKFAADENNGTPNLYVESNSKYAINALTRNLTRNEDLGYMGMANAEILQATAATLRNKKGKTLLKWVKGHHRHKRNEEANQMAILGAQKDYPSRPDYTTNTSANRRETKQINTIPSIQGHSAEKVTIRVTSAKGHGGND